MAYGKGKGGKKGTKGVNMKTGKYCK